MMTAAWLLKSCPKCHGDLHPEHDGFDEVLVCFQCGSEFRKQAPVADQPSNGWDWDRKPGATAGKRKQASVSE